MGLTLPPDESYENWIKRVKQYETGRALMDLARGDDPEQVMHNVSQRIVNKLMHPILQAINSMPSDYNSLESQEHYLTNYQKRFDPKPDHIKDDRWD